MTPPNFADMARELFECPNHMCERGLDHNETCAVCGGEWRPDADHIAAALARVAAEAAKVERDRADNDCCRKYTPCRHGLKEWKR